MTFYETLCANLIIFFCFVFVSIKMPSNTFFLSMNVLSNDVLIKVKHNFGLPVTVLWHLSLNVSMSGSGIGIPTGVSDITFWIPVSTLRFCTGFIVVCFDEYIFKQYFLDISTVSVDCNISSLWDSWLCFSRRHNPENEKNYDVWQNMWRC